MKQSEIKVGNHYIAKVSNQLTTVRVDEIGKSELRPGYRRAGRFYACTNLTTGRKVTFKSASKFRQGANSENKNRSQADKKTIAKAKTEAVMDKQTKDTQSPKANYAPHVIVKALAGTGKTTTMVEAIRITYDGKSDLTPSTQQQAVWDAIGEGAKLSDSVCFVAFNKAIAEELKTRVPEGVDAMTLHSLGFAAVRNAFGYKQPKGYWPIVDIIGELMEMDPREIQKTKPNLLKSTEKLVSLCKMNLIGFDPTGTYTLNQVWEDQLANLAAHYDVDLNGDAEEVFALVPRVLEECKVVAKRSTITFDDMIWLPVVLNLPVNQYDLLLVDEAQDLNRCQQALARKAGDRLILCGDVNQAIYGFAGADSESMARMAEELGGDNRCEANNWGPHIIDSKGYCDKCSIGPRRTPEIKDRGCVELPLTVTRRCGKAIVKEAQKIVPEFEAHEDNPVGRIFEMHIEPITNQDMSVYSSHAKNGDMVLCRVNAPLVSECFKFLRNGRKAIIRGRDIGTSLISTIKKMKANDIGELSYKLSDWLHTETTKENRKKNPSDTRLIALQDRYDCLECFIEDAETIEAVISKIEGIFTDDKDNVGILLSSVHRAKGLESQRVFILQPKGAEMPHPMAKSEWQREQERNCLYIAITRAIEELIYVS